MLESEKRQQFLLMHKFPRAEKGRVAVKDAEETFLMNMFTIMHMVMFSQVYKCVKTSNCVI